ncbi:MAG: 3-hydroxyacyl-ACP dehydratase FabZ [Gammaproteobacteria bacterium]
MENLILDIEKILALLPHRYPFLLVDRVVEYSGGESLVAYKNVTCNEPFFNGHFPERRVMPGVLILEAMAQATALLAFHSGDVRRDPNAVYYLVGVDKARFKKPVVPGDRLYLHVRLERELRGVYRYEAVARVDGHLVASATIMATQAISGR